MTNDDLRKYIRGVIMENVSNFLAKQPETKTLQLKDGSNPENLGDPISDVKLNQLADDLGSDGKNAPTVAVHAASAKRNGGPTTGQHQAKFSDKTELGN